VARSTPKDRFPPHALTWPLDENAAPSVERGDGSDQRALARFEVKAVQNRSLPFNYSRCLVGLVEEIKKKGRIGSVINRCEMSDILLRHCEWSLYNHSA
jgi:hypothetical protein